MAIRTNTNMASGKMLSQRPEHKTAAKPLPSPKLESFQSGSDSYLDPTLTSMKTLAKQFGHYNGTSGKGAINVYPTSNPNRLAQNNGSEQQGPVPTTVVLPEVTGEPPESRPSASFIGKAPAPIKLDMDARIQGLDRVEMARKYEGHAAKSLGAGGMTEMTDLTCLDNTNSGNTNNCANFVSAVRRRTGSKDKHSISVPQTEKMIQKGGWRAIPKDEVIPGDLYFTRWDGSTHGHIEIATTPSGEKTIGANTDNRGTGYQSVLERPTRPGGKFYTQRKDKPAF